MQADHTLALMGGRGGMHTIMYSYDGDVSYWTTSHAIHFNAILALYFSKTEFSFVSVKCSHSPCFTKHQLHLVCILDRLSDVIVY